MKKDELLKLAESIHNGSASKEEWRTFAQHFDHELEEILKILKDTKKNHESRKTNI